MDNKVVKVFYQTENTAHHHSENNFLRTFFTSIGTTFKLHSYHDGQLEFLPT